MSLVNVAAPLCCSSSKKELLLCVIGTLFAVFGHDKTVSPFYYSHRLLIYAFYVLQF